MWLLLMPMLSMANPGKSEDESLDHLIRQVAEVYVDEVDVEVLHEAAREGLFRWLEVADQTGIFRVLDSDAHQRLLARARGERTGIGVSIVVVPGYGVRVQEVFQDTPAAETGLSTGDVLLEVDGTPVKDQTPDALGRLLEVSEGTRLNLKVVTRAGIEKEVTLEPRLYKVPPVSVTERRGFRLVRVHHMGAGAGHALGEACRDMGGDGALVLDLRGAGDGLPEEALAAASLFIGKDRGVTAGHAQGPCQPWEGRLALLVNGGTRGVPELFAAVVQRGRDEAVLVGSPTGGVAHVPRYIEAGSDVVLQVPGARLALDDGTTWHRVGVVPDVLVEAMPGPFFMPPPAPLPDLQVDAAIRLVSSP